MQSTLHMNFKYTIIFTKYSRILMEQFSVFTIYSVANAVNKFTRKLDFIEIIIIALQENYVQKFWCRSL